MRRRVGIVALAQTRYQQRRDDVEIAELIYEVVEEILGQTTLTFGDDRNGIGSTVSCSQDHWDGRTISSQPVCDVAGGHLRPEEKVAGDGTLAVYYGALQILSGHYDKVLVVAHCKESQTDGSLIENAGFDHLYHRQLGMDFLIAGAMQANQYMRRHGTTREQCAEVVIKNRTNGALSAYSPGLPTPTMDDVLNAPMLADPISALDSKPAADGACALILASEEETRRLTDKPVWILGMGCCYDAHFLGQRDLSESRALQEATRRAYQMAGISSPRREINLVELSESYSYQELMWLEGLGLCDAGEAGKLTMQGSTRLSGSLPVNASGGLLSGVPVTVAGLNRVAEVTRQLRGEAGDAQVQGARVGLAQGTSGACGQTQCVLALGRD